MKIAAAAYPIDWHNRWNDYVGKLRVWVRTAAERGAELLVFPEYGALELASLAGEENARDPERVVDAVNARIKDVDELHGSLAREFAVHICAGSGPVRRAGDRLPVNRARLFAPDGSSAAQDKLVPTRFEREKWGLSPGAPPRVFETKLGRIGILLGQDAAQPLLARAMTAAGAEILLAPGLAESTRGYWRLRVPAMARALEGRCIVVQAVTVGPTDWLPLAAQTHGAAAIYAPPEEAFPEDGVIAAGKPDVAGWVHGEVSLDALRQTREAEGAGPADDWPATVEAVETVTLGAAEEA
ncbi:carbon-nitrogen hydrolase family protein [Amaricoccus sp.]|uniref:carbon-nitrogen hydrolase family protein n=1 Tax=Amaricoccus sp. TaxID=1872485 RepID=UPI002618CA4E|nr:carbon-nitrogen hydrolase family protein [Amaricoccus sp.]HRO11384.1 carbon-nitrogen hydrolase family protein [Amaricoccus sp.]